MESTPRIHLLGLLRICIAGETITLTSRNLMACMGYLSLYASQGRAATRSKIAGILFPDQSEAYARRLLSETLYRLRRLLGERASTLLRIKGEQIGLHPVWVDVIEFRSLTAGKDPKKWGDAIELYSGDLLEDLDSEWVEGLRASLHDLYLSILERSCTASIEAGELPAALNYAHRWTLADPLHEKAHWTVMKLFVLLGRHSAALEQYNRLTRLLADELQIEPLPEIRHFASLIRAELDGFSHSEYPYSFVGRRRERAMLLEQAEKAQNEFQFTAIEELGREGVRPDELAWHFEQAEDWGESVSYHLQAGDQATKIFAYTTALEHYNQGLNLLSHLIHPEGLRLMLLFHRQTVFGILHRVSEWQADVEEIESIASKQVDTSSLLEALEARLNLQVAEGDLDGAQATGVKALALARELEDTSTEARLALAIGRQLRIRVGQASQALPYLERAVELAQATRDYPLLSSTLCHLASAQVRMGRCTAARASAAWVLAIIEQQPELHPLRPEALFRLAEVSQCTGEWELARSTLRQAMQQQYAMGKLWEMGEVAFEFAVTCAEMGQYQEAVQAIDFIIGTAAHAGIDLDRSEVILQFKVLIAFAHLLAGHLSEAELALNTVSDLVSISQGTRSSIEYSFIAGLLHLFQGQPDEAIPLLAHTVEASPPELIAETVIGCLGHALASCQIDDLEGARASLTRAERIIASSDGCRYNVLLEFTRYRVSGAIQHLLAAHDELQRQASLFADARLRNDFIEQVHWNREVRIHWLRLRSTSEPLHVRLARLDAPLGKHLTDDERVDVSWNVDDGDGDAETLRQAGKAAQRRRRLRRLLLEARAQGAVPTDADLARALDVTERTIRRDMQALKAENQPVSTRRRKKLIS